MHQVTEVLEIGETKITRTKKKAIGVGMEAGSIEAEVVQ